MSIKNAFLLLSSNQPYALDYFYILATALALAYSTLLVLLEMLIWMDLKPTQMNSTAYHVPTCSNPTSTMSPSFNQTGGVRPEPTPAGLGIQELAWNNKLLVYYLRSSEDNISRHKRDASAKEGNTLLDAEDHIGCIAALSRCKLENNGLGASKLT